MKKVGIITLFYNNYNYGGMLQAFALQQFIEMQGFECEQIAIDRMERGKKDWNYKIKRIYWSLRKAPYRLVAFTRRKRFRQFQNVVKHSKKIYNISNVYETNTIYDMFICGSDQIWNDWNNSQQEINCNNLFFAAEGKRKIAYSASTGTTAFSKEFCRKIGPGIKKLDYISVREKSAVQQIKKLSGKDVQVTLDPVLLLDREYWGLLANRSKKRVEGKYALCYFLGGDKEDEETAINVASSLGLKVIVLYFCESFIGKRKGNVQYDVSSGPIEFVDLIRNAEMVFTNSFHAVMFSVLFHKEFYTYLRSTKVQGVSMNSRIMDFVHEFGIEEVLTTRERFIRSSIDYKRVDAQLCILRKKSEKYLMQALN